MSETQNRVGTCVLTLPNDYEQPSREDIDRLNEQFAHTVARGGLLVAPPGATITRLDCSPTQAQMDRLIKLLSLTEQERAFVRAALADDVDRDLFCVLADYLEDNGKLQLAERYRNTES